MKKLLLFFLILSACLCRGQTPFLSTYGLYSFGVADSSTVSYRNGTIFYNVQKNAWRVYANGALGALSRQANNGITSTFGHYQLGGDLIKNTTIDAQGNDYTITGLGTYLLDGATFISQTNLLNLTYPSTGEATQRIFMNAAGISLVGTDINHTGSVSYGTDLTISSWSADQNNLSIASTRNVRIQSSQAVNVTGIVAPLASHSRQIRFKNIGSFPITFPHEDTNSTDVNRFSHPNGQDFVVAPGATVIVEYDDTDNRWIVVSGVIIGAVSAPPASPSQLTPIVLGSTSADVFWRQGGGDFGILLISESPIANFPSDDISYTASATYGSGSDIGSNVYVAAIFEDSEQFEWSDTVTVTGLSAGTPYFITALNYNIDGSFIRYNIASSQGINSNEFTTHASSSTPTVPYTISSVLTKEDSIIITGTAGNGTSRAVLMAENKEVDAFFVDDQSYSADDFGTGDEVGTGNYVVLNGVDTSPLRLAGFSRDKEYSNPYIAEYTSLKYLLEPAHGPPDSLLRTAWIYDQKFTATPPVGQIDLETNSEVFYDFTQLTGSAGTTISNGNAGLEDYGPAAFTSTTLNSPQVETFSISTHTVSALESTGTAAVDTGTDGVPWIQGNDFEIIWGVKHFDGQHAGTNAYFGGVSADFSSRLDVTSNGFGILTIRFNSPTHQVVWNSNAAVFSNGENDHKVFRVRFDFTTDTFTVFMDGSTVAGSFSVGTFSSATSSDWDIDKNFLVGNINGGGGSLTSQATTFYITRFAITPLKTTQQATDIETFFGYIPTGSENWTAHETVGFTHSVVDDTLTLSGQPVGFQDYIIRKDIVPDSLHEFTVSYTVKVSNDLATGDSGTGPIIINDVDGGENNHAVYALFVTNPTSGSFGRLQIYSGNGAVSPTAIAFRAQTSGTVPVAKDSVFTISLTRTIIDGTANILFVAKLVNYTGTQLSVSWTDFGGLSSQYIGTTAHVGIWQNGGPFKINPFVVRREGSEITTGGGGSGEPGPVSYEVWVMKTGDDDNACTEALPCLTVGRGADRVDELGPGTDMFIGAGTYIEPSYVVWSTDLDTLDGAGKTQTIIKGSPGLYTDVTTGSGAGNPFSTEGYLFQFKSGSSIDDHTVIRNLSMEGNRNVGGYANSMKGGVIVLRRDNYQFHDVDVRYFWSTGIWLWDVDSAWVNSCHLQENGFSNPVPGITYSLGNIQLFGQATKIWITNSFIDSPVFDQGQGLQHGGAPNFYRLDVHGHNNEFDVGGSSDGEDHHFASELLYMFMQTGDSLSFTGNIFRKNISFGYTGTQAGVVYIHDNQFLLPIAKNLAIEAQIPNVEVCHNYFTNIWGKAIGTYNSWGVICPRDCQPENQVWSGLNIHNNVIEMAANQIAGDAVFGDQQRRRDDVTIENNTVVFLSSGGPLYRLLRGGSQGVNDNWLIQNNAIHGQPAPGSTLWSIATGTMTNSTFRFNKATHLNVNATQSGVTSSNNVVTGAGNTLGFNLTGAKPFPFYAWPSSNTVLKNAGQGGADIGAYTD